MAQEVDKLLAHDADGIQEYDNALPRWWLYGFYFTIIVSVAYIIYFHGMGGPGSAKEYENEVAEAAIIYKAAAKKDLSSLTALTDQASLDEGKKIFDGTTNPCFTCHRNDMGGQVGPNLTDEYWINGGTLQDIMKSITTGFPDKGMPPYGSGAKLDDKQLHQLASYILSKQGSNPPDPKPIDPAREVKASDAGAAATTDTAAH